MAQSTPGFGLPIIEPAVDRIKSADEVSALANDINNLATRADAGLSRVGEKAGAGNATAANAKAEAAAASARNLAQDMLLTAQDLRVKALELLGGLTPGSVSDGTVAGLIANGSSLTTTAILNKAVGRGDQVFDPRDFGAVSGVDTDASAAFLAAIAAAKSTGGRVFCRGTYRIDQPLFFDVNGDLSDCTLKYYGAGTAVTVKGVRLVLHLPSVVSGVKVAGNNPGWGTVAGTVGVRLENINGCFITVPFVQNFETGLYCIGTNGGNAYNTITLGWLFNNKVNQFINTETSTSTGYTNQNVFIGGRMSHYANEGTALPEVFTLKITGDGDGGPNNNTWVNTCFEGAVPAISIDFDKARDNVFINPRLEYANSIRFGAGSRRNLLQGGYGTGTVVVTRIPGETANIMDGSTKVTVRGKHTEYQQDTDAYPWLKFEQLPRKLYLGNGSSPALDFWRSGNSYLETNATLYAETDGVVDIGAATSRRWRDLNMARDVTAGRAVSMRTTSETIEPAPNQARLFSRATGGKVELCVRFPTGSIQVLASQP